MSNSNVILIVDMTQLDNDGNIVVKYMYDAWGNQKILTVSSLLGPFGYLFLFGEY